jgi:hypothetical protein
MTLSATLLFAPSSDSYAAVACMPQTSCPLSAINNGTIAAGIPVLYVNDYGGASAGVTWQVNLFVLLEDETASTYYVHGTHWCATNIGYGFYPSPVKGQSPSGSNGPYCYCRLLDISDIGCAGSWVYVGVYTDASSCSNSCTFFCAGEFRDSLIFRAALMPYKTFDASSCPANYVAIPSNVETIVESGVACSKGTCNISCNWQ